MHEKVKSVRQVCLLNEHLPFLLAKLYIISQPLSSQPQPPPQAETEMRSTRPRDNSMLVGPIGRYTTGLF